MSSRVRINVGGRIFETTRATLEQAGRDSLLGALVDPIWSDTQSWSGIADVSRGKDIPEVFLDRDPEVFDVLLRMLRTGVLHVPPSVTWEALIEDADYLGLLEQVKAAALPPPLDGNEMEKVRKRG